MSSNNDPTMTTIPKERLNYMIEAATAIRIQDKVTPIQFKTILLNSYTTNSNLMGMYLQDDLMNRAEQFTQSWEPDNTFWANISEVLVEDKYEKLKEYFKNLPADSEDFKHLKHLLYELKLNKDIYMSDINRFENSHIGDIIATLYENKKRKSKLFGGKGKKSRKGRKSSKARKSKKSRKGRKSGK